MKRIGTIYVRSNQKKAINRRYIISDEDAFPELYTRVSQSVNKGPAGVLSKWINIPALIGLFHTQDMDNMESNTLHFL